MATLKRDYSIRLDNYIQLTEPQTLEDVLSQFVGEVNNEVTRQRIIFALDNWNMRNGTNITIDDLELN
jgi:Mg2+/Co2+ transporter CorC